MKKAVSCFLLLFLLLGALPKASAAGSASLTGPSTVRAGDTITLTFSAGGGIYGGSGTVSYDSSQLTLQKYSSSLSGSWKVEFSGNKFIFYDDSMASPISGGTAIFTATFQVNGSVAAGTNVTVTASAVTVSDGQKDTAIGSVSYSTTIAPPLSGNCNLASMTVSNATISPAFSPAVTSYSASVPYEVSSLNLSTATEHAGAKVSVSNNKLAVAATTTVKITVTAENGATKTYSIKVARAQDPNYVASSNAALSSLSAEGYALSPAFQADRTQYYVWLPYEAEAITLAAQCADGKASLVIGTYEQLLPGEGTDIPVTVTAEDGTQQIYTVTVIRAPENPEDFLNPVPETTEPVTEPTTEPTTEPVTEPTQAPTPEPSEGGSGNGILVLVITGILCAIAGGGITALIVFLYRRKIDREIYNL